MKTKPPTDHVIRKDETPATFAEMKPPGYWCATAGRFVEVRMVSDEEFRERSFVFDEDFIRVEKEQQFIKFLEEATGRELSPQEVALALALKQARALGEI